MKPPTTKREALPAEKRKRVTIQSLTTTELENFARYYEEGHGVVNTFERTAILKGIKAELTERTIEAELRRAP